MDRPDLESWKSSEVAKLLAMLESQRRYYEDMFSSLPVGLAVLSGNRSIVSTNRAFRQTFGLRVEDLRGKTIEKILPSGRLIEKIRDVVVHGILQPALLLEQDGKALRIAIVPFRGWEQGEMETLVTVTDISDVHSHPPAGKDSFPVPSVENFPAAFWRANAGSLQFTWVGGAVAGMLGYPASHWLQASDFFGQRIHAEDRDAVLALYRNAIAQSVEASAEFRSIASSGEAMWCRETVRMAEPGVLAGVLVESGRRRQVEQLRVMAERNSALHNLSARLAHDLNNPLMIVSGYAEEMLQALEAKDPRRSELQQIIEATGRMGNLTAQLLQFTRKQAKPAQRVELAALLSGLAHVRIEMRAPIPVFALADPQQLEEILLILTDGLNEERSRVTITCETEIIAEQVAGATLAPGTYARLTLHTPGRGLDDEKRDVMFESFLQTASGNSSGPALARAYGIIRECGGELGFESGPAGSTFTIYLPLAESGLRTAAPSESSSGSGAAIPAPETILVVEDETGIRSLMVKILRRERYRVLEAGSAAEAIAAAAAQHDPIDLLLTDVMLPDRNGRQLAQELLQAYPTLKVTYVSGFTGDKSLRRIDFPPDARFLQKPFTLTALIETVRETLDN